MEYSKPNIEEILLSVNSVQYESPDGASQCSSSCCWGEGCWWA